MKIEYKIILLCIYGVCSFIIFVIQCIHSSKGQFSSKDLKEKINNWKLNPIIDISLSPKSKGYSENDYSTYNGFKIYFKRMKHYNFAKLKVQEKKLINSQVCGKTEDYENDIVFPNYENCPINHLNISQSCNESEFNCIPLGNEYIAYSNKKIKQKIIVEVDFDVLSPIGYISLENDKNIPSNFENIFKIPQKLKIKNIFAIIFSTIMVLTFIMGAYVFILILLGKEFIEVKFLVEFPLFIFIVIAEGLFIIYLIGAIRIKEGLNILNSIDEKNLENKKIFNLEMTNLVFSFTLTIVHYIINKISILNNKYEQKMEYYFLRINLGGIIIGIFLIPIIFLLINLSKKPFNNGFIEDLILNYKMSPITQIDISKESTITNNLHSSYFDPKVPYKLGKIIQKKDNSEQKENINSWKGTYFYVSRMNSDLTYPKIFSYYYKKDKKLCGKDSNGNDLYFPLNEYCPINYINITSSKDPPIEGNYNWTRKQIDSTTYMHYTNSKTDGEILVL